MALQLVRQEKDRIARKSPSAWYDPGWTGRGCFICDHTMTQETASSFADWLAAHPEVTRVEAFLTDVNGAPKGKWLVRDKALALAAKGLPMPLSVFALDAWGCDVPGRAGLRHGRPDGLCWPVAGRWSKAPWLGEDSAQVFLGMVDKDGRGRGRSARHAQGPAGALCRARADPVVATELEFYLYRLDHGVPVPPDGNMARNDTLSTTRSPPMSRCSTRSWRWPTPWASPPTP
jgi:glutamine synthetase